MGDHDHSASLASEREIGADQYGVQGLPPIEGMIRFAGLDEDVTDLVTDAYEIAIDGDAAPRIVDDFLVVTVSRGGGCEEHDLHPGSRLQCPGAGAARARRRHHPRQHG